MSGCVGVFVCVVDEQMSAIYYLSANTLHYRCIAHVIISYVADTWNYSHIGMHVNIAWGIRCVLLVRYYVGYFPGSVCTISWCSGASVSFSKYSFLRI